MSGLGDRVGLRRAVEKWREKGCCQMNWCELGMVVNNFLGVFGLRVLWNLGVWVWRRREMNLEERRDDAIDWNCE